MKNLKRITLILMLLTAIFCVINISEAASISASPNPAEVGKSVTITVSVPNVNTVDLTATVSGAGTSGTIRLVDGSMTGEARTFSKSITVTPTSAGTISVAISGGSNAVLNGQYVDVSASTNITVKEPVSAPKPEQPEKPSNNGNTTTKPNNNNTTTKPTETKKSSNSRLDTLKIAEGILTPEFDSKTREYTINVPNEVTKLSIEAITDDSKASAKITGNDELQIGENTIEIIVTAEDGSTSTYTIKAIRADTELGLQSLNVFYIDENGEKVQIDLNPVYEVGLFEYTLKAISYKIDNLIVEAIATRENAKIEIIGHEKLKTGENIITIKVISNEEQTEEPSEDEEGDIAQPEEKVYTIKVNKEAEPVVAPLTTMQKIKNWFSGAGVWFSNNFSKIQTVALIVSTTLFVGLTVYYVRDYKNYKKLVEQLAEINKTNLMEKANFAVNGEEKSGTIEDDVTEENETTEVLNENKNTLNENLDKFFRTDERDRTKQEKGRRFKK